MRVEITSAGHNNNANQMGGGRRKSIDSGFVSLQKTPQVGKWKFLIPRSDTAAPEIEGRGRPDVWTSAESNAESLVEAVPTDGPPTRSQKVVAEFPVFKLKIAHSLRGGQSK